MNRRHFLRLAAAGAAGAFVGGCASERQPGPQAAGTASPAPTASASSAGGARAFTLRAQRATVDLGRLQVPTWTYGGEVPGREIRVRKGEVVEARLINELTTDTSVHWHGVVLPNEMDGVPGATQQPVAAGTEFLYRFPAAVSGTYWFHPHSGLQLERGLYAPLIIEDPADGSTYDEEWVVVFDDWLDGIDGASPEGVWRELRGGMGHGGHGGHGGGAAASPTASPTAAASTDHASISHGVPAASSPSSAASPPAAGMLMGATSPVLGGDAGDVRYQHHLINGRTSADPRTFHGRPGQRVRIRMINAGGDTAYRVALGGHRMTVTHTDGFPVRPVTAGALLIGMGERYDVEVTLGDGAFPLVALAEGKNQTAVAFLRTSASATPPAVDVRPGELEHPVLRYNQLTPAEGHALAPRNVNREHRLELNGGMAEYDWTINGRPFDSLPPFEVTAGERVRLTFVNNTEMWHPMHLHGHTFQLDGGGPRKDTVAVLPKQSVVCDFDAEHPGTWMIHCHNSYHLEAGMMGVLRYTS